MMDVKRFLLEGRAPTGLQRFTVGRQEYAASAGYQPKKVSYAILLYSISIYIYMWCIYVCIYVYIYVCMYSSMNVYRVCSFFYYIFT